MLGCREFHEGCPLWRTRKQRARSSRHPSRQHVDKLGPPLLAGRHLHKRHRRRSQRRGDGRTEGHGVGARRRSR